MAARSRSTRRTKAAYHHGDLRRALLDGASVLIREKGLGGFTLREVARRVGVTHAAAYRHFEDKNALAVAIAGEGYAALTDVLGAPLDTNGDVVARLEELSRRYLEFALRHPADYRVMFGPRLNESGRYPELEVAIERLFRTVEDRLFAGFDLPPVERREINVALLTQVHGYCDLVHERRIRVKSQKAAREFYLRIARPFFEGVAARLVGRSDDPPRANG